MLFKADHGGDCPTCGGSHGFTEISRIDGAIIVDRFCDELIRRCPHLAAVLDDAHARLVDTVLKVRL
jgi:hypothetical protein